MELLEAQRQTIEQIEALQEEITGEIGKAYLTIAKLEARRMELQKAVDLMVEEERSELIDGRI